MQQYALWTLFNGVPFVVAALLGLLLPLFVLMLARSFEAGLAFVLLVFVLDAVFIGGGALYVGFNLHGSDLGYGLLFVAGLGRWMFVREGPTRSRAFAVLVALVLLGVVIGLAIEGRRAGVQARETFYALACAGWAMSFPIDERRMRRLLHALAAACLVLLALAVYRWVVYLIPVPDLLPANGVWSIDVATRVIASGETLLVAQWLVLGLVFGAWRLGPLAVARWLAPALFTAVVVLQHRSVWIAGVVGLLAAWSLGRRAQGSRPLQAAILAAAVAVVAVPAVLSDRLAPLTREIGQSAANAATGQGTVHARLSDWRRALREFAGEGPRTWLVGQGYGRDTSRITFTESGERRVVRFGLHNHYLALLVHHGLLGLAAYLALIGGTAWALWQRVRSAPAHDPEAWIAPVLLVLLAMQTAYHLPYAGDPLQHLLLGVAVAYAARVGRPVAAAGSADAASATGATGTAGAVVPRRAAAHDVAWR